MEHTKKTFLGAFLDLWCIYLPPLKVFLLASLLMASLPMEISPGVIAQPQQLFITWFGKWMNLHDLVVSSECLKQLTEWRVSDASLGLGSSVIPASRPWSTNLHWRGAPIWFSAYEGNSEPWWAVWLSLKALHSFFLYLRGHEGIT